MNAPLHPIVDLGITRADAAAALSHLPEPSKTDCPIQPKAPAMTHMTGYHQMLKALDDAHARGLVDGSVRFRLLGETPAEWTLVTGDHQERDRTLHIGNGIVVRPDSTVDGERELHWRGGHVMENGDRTVRFTLGGAALTATWNERATADNPQAERTLFDALVEDAGDARAFDPASDMGHVDDSLRDFVAGTWVGEHADSMFGSFAAALLASLRDRGGDLVAQAAARHGLDPVAFAAAHRDLVDDILARRANRNPT